VTGRAASVGSLIRFPERLPLAVADTVSGYGLSPLSALSGRNRLVGECLLSRDERTRAGAGSTSANDPKRHTTKASCHVFNARLRTGFVGRQKGFLHEGVTPSGRARRGQKRDGLVHPSASRIEPHSAAPRRPRAYKQSAGFFGTDSTKGCPGNADLKVAGLSLRRMCKSGSALPVLA
jgi:hypothetical protein